MTTTLDDIRGILQRIQDVLDSKVQNILISGNQIQTHEGLSDIDHRLGLIQAGEFRTGNGKIPGDGFSGVRIGFPPFLYGGTEWNIVGVNNDVMEIGIRASDGKLVAGAGAVIVDVSGITLENDEQGFNFKNAAGVANINIWTDSNDNLNFYQGNVDSFFTWQVEETDGGSPSQMTFEEGLTGQAVLRLRGHAGGEMLNVGDALYLKAEGDTSGDTSIIMAENATASPNDFLTINGDMQIYLRNDKFIIKYSDGGTLRYKYLDLTGTGTLWTHTTSAP